SPVRATFSSESWWGASVSGAPCASAADAHMPATRTEVPSKRSADGETTTSDSRLLQSRRVVQRIGKAEHAGTIVLLSWATSSALRMRGAEHGAFGLWTRVVGQTTRPFLFRSPPK